MLAVNGGTGLLPSNPSAERVALGRVAGLVAVHEPGLALLGGAVGPGLGVDATLELLLNAVVADGGGGIAAASLGRPRIPRPSP